MSSYRGEATVVIGEAEYDVTADLHSDTDQVVIQSSGRPAEVLHGLSHWRGSLDVEDDGVAWAIYEAGQAALRLPGGKTATFHARGGVIGSTRIDITGTSPVSFPA
ncbi:hypothetical protein ABT264_29250 [Streptomyces virginiae]|uniref:hypothetical protein n=1 Tax=Streptomyces virginiae TaxID=1961 RepID=UPI00332A242B